VGCRLIGVYPLGRRLVDLYPYGECRDGQPLVRGQDAGGHGRAGDLSGAGPRLCAGGQPAHAHDFTAGLLLHPDHQRHCGHADQPPPYRRSTVKPRPIKINSTI
jgi:hypothetical protein